MKQNKRRVFCIGETVLDIIFKGGLPIAATPGGSMLNTAVSLGRCGVEVYFISDFAKDPAGDLIQGFLERNGVSTRYIDRYDEGKTGLALAFLNEKQDAAYTFYKDYPAERLKMDLPEAGTGDIVLFGSFFALTELVRDKLISFTKKSREHGAFLIYDPNFRKPHAGELDILMPWILENIRMSDMVRGSNEDFDLIFSAGSSLDAYKHIVQAGCPALVYTKNKEGVELLASGLHLSIAVAPIDPVSTIGAGDAFNAGVIYALLQQPPTPSGWVWETVLQYGSLFSANVCMSLENYISIEFADSIDRK